MEERWKELKKRVNETLEKMEKGEKRGEERIVGQRIQGEESRNKREVKKIKEGRGKGNV